MDQNIEKNDNAERKARIRERYRGIDTDELEVIHARVKENIRKDTSEKRVAVYARVSTDDPNQTSSYELQKNHYTDFVNSHPNWKLVKIYADEGISGTSLQHRDSFLEMIRDCEAGKIDMIITKHVSRFARNIVDCIKIERDLKKLNPPVGVYFETENLYTLEEDSEVMLSIMAMMAQEESHTKSEIMNASIEMRFRRGIFLTPTLLGYDKDENGNLIINEDEAKIVRLIFYMYLAGYTCQEIADTLTNFGQKTKTGKAKWSASTILQILQNERHCGDVLARKTFTPNYLDHKSKKNRQDRNQYLHRDNHEAIISRDDFIAVQRLISNAKYGNKGILPQLHVITEGILKGFVSINPRWAGFKVEDYHTASQSVMTPADENVSLPTEIEVNSGDFDLREYEIARGQFFETSNRITVTLSRETIYFSTAALHKFNDQATVEFLIHPEKRLFAVRPCTAENRNHFIWGHTKDAHFVPRIIHGTAFLPSIFKLLDWKIDYKYRIYGICRHKGDEMLLLFNLDEAEILIPPNVIVPSDVNVKKSTIGYPAEWLEGFGNSYYLHAQSKELAPFSQTEIWNTQSEGQPYTESDINVTPQADINSHIDKLLNEMRSPRNEQSDCK